MTKVKQGITVNKQKPVAYTIEVDSEDGKTTYKVELSKPNRAIIEVVLGLIVPPPGTKPEYIKAGEIILNSCKVSGDEEIWKDEELLIAACMQAYTIIEYREARIKKH